MQRYFIIHKPFGFVSRYLSTDGQPGLNELFKLPRDIYPVGRLDRDSEGLLLLTNDKKINHLLLDPQRAHEREYLVQVDGQATESALDLLSQGIVINIQGKFFQTKSCQAFIAQQPPWLEERSPPVRFRQSIPTSWIRIILTEGKNRQVRKMTAAVGFPTLRLIRTRIEQLYIDELPTGAIKEISRNRLYNALGIGKG